MIYVGGQHDCANGCPGVADGLLLHCLMLFRLVDEPRIH